MFHIKQLKQPKKQHNKSTPNFKKLISLPLKYNIIKLPKILEQTLIDYQHFDRPS